MEIVIWGMGAVGLGLASALANNEGSEGDEPDAANRAPGLRLLGRDTETRKALERHGIHRSGLFGEALIPPDRFRVGADPETLLSPPPDWLFVCTKAFATRDVAALLEPIAPALLARTRILLCQNGWGNEAPLLPFWPKERLFHARIITGFRRPTPHQVEITAHASPIALGSIFGTDPTPLGDIARALSSGGIPTELRSDSGSGSDMEGVLWAKMLYNCALNPLGALVGRRYGELTDDPQTRAIVECVVCEIFEVLAHTGHRVEWPDAKTYLESFHAELIPPTRTHESSMLQDLRAGRKTEIEALCGAVERLGSEHGVETPVVSALAQLVRVAEARGPQAARQRS